MLSVEPECAIQVFTGEVIDTSQEQGDDHPHILLLAEEAFLSDKIK